MEKKWRIITGTLGMDAHVIGTKYLSRALKEAGFKVIELGCLTPPDEFIKVAMETNADAILISSLYGMAELDLDGFKEKCQEAGIGRVLLYIGGNLASCRDEYENFESIETKFKNLGFHRVYGPKIDLSIAIENLKNDLEKKYRVSQNSHETTSEL
jgi:methylaspartate mutase S subunit